MSTTQSTDETGAGHPLLRFSMRVRAALGQLAGTAAWSMTTEEQRTALVELAAAEAQLVELRMRVLAAGDKADLAADSAASSTQAWVAEATRQTRPEAYRDVVFAGDLDAVFGVTREAMAAGEVNAAQGRVIVAAVKALPDTATDQDRAAAEAWLIKAAAEHDAAALKALGRHIYEVLDPAAAEEALGKKLAREEARARRLTFLDLFDNGDGTASGRFKIPALHASMLKKALAGLMAPRHIRRGEQSGAGETAERKPTPERRGEAFCRFLERYPIESLPKAGGLSASVVVTVRLEALRDWWATASLDDGSRISAGEARRLACGAGIIPAVLGGDSEVLDLGRTRRFHSAAQRVAMGLRDGGCVAEGCRRPAAECEAHHFTSWAAGGPTTLQDGGLLCSWHHHRAHDPRYEVCRQAGGKVTFHRRQ